MFPPIGSHVNDSEKKLIKKWKMCLLFQNSKKKECVYFSKIPKKKKKKKVRAYDPGEAGTKIVKLPV